MRKKNEDLTKMNSGTTTGRTSRVGFLNNKKRKIKFEEGISITDTFQIFKVYTLTNSNTFEAIEEFYNDVTPALGC